MYEHFGSGNIQPIELSICGGLLGSLRARISERPPNVMLKWTLHEYLSSPKLVSYKAAVAPRPKGAPPGDSTGIKQAVVRIHTLQSLQHVKRMHVKEKGVSFAKDIQVDVSGRELQLPRDPRENAKVMVEYVVVQKMMMRSKEGPWMIWGMTEETTVDKLKQEGRKEERRRKELKKEAQAKGAVAPSSA